MRRIEPMQLLTLGLSLGLGLAGTLSGAASAASLPETVALVKKSVVGVGTYQRTRTPAIRFSGTGFVTGDGLSVITNAHVVPESLDPNAVETLGIVVGSGEGIEFRPATLAGRDREHDLAHLRLTGLAMPALTLGEEAGMQEGRDIAFTGFPLAMTLGLHPATHRGLLAAITPIVMPSLSSRQLNPGAIVQLQRAPFQIYQLDATAYPGNSGSPVYDPATGVVYGIINMVFVKGLKETAITNPSGITYAVPAHYARDLMQRKSPESK